jgi:DNA-binding MarR family transcriptional regulator
MGQQDVYEYLKKNKSKWLSARDIAAGLKASLGSVTNNLKKLRESKQIYFRMNDRTIKPAGKKKIYEYKFKR